MLKLQSFGKFLEVMATAVHICACTMYTYTQKYALHKHRLTHELTSKTLPTVFLKLFNQFDLSFRT